MATATKTVQRIRNFLGGREYNIALRYAKDQQARTLPDPNIPDGDAHLLSDNYYLTRDGRRDVRPAMVVTPTVLQIADKGAAGETAPFKLSTPADVLHDM